MEAVAFAQTREAGPRTRWFIATGTAAASRCIKVNTQPPSGPNPASPNRHHFPHLGSNCQFPSRPSPRPAPAPFCGRGLTRRVGGGAEGVWAAHVGESVCGLDCHVMLRSLSSVIRPPPAPGAAGLRTLGGGGRRRGGVGARARAPRPWPRGCGFGLGSGEPPPPPAAPSAAVSGDFLYHGVGLGSAARGAGADPELGGLPCRFRFGGGGRRLPHPKLSGRDLAAAPADWSFPRRRGGRPSPQSRRRGRGWAELLGVVDEAVEWPHRAPSSASVTGQKRRWWRRQ